MVSSKAATVEEYLAELPENRRADIQQVREIILALTCRTGSRSAYSTG